MHPFLGQSPIVGRTHIHDSIQQQQQQQPARSISALGVERCCNVCRSCEQGCRYWASGCYMNRSTSLFLRLGEDDDGWANETVTKSSVWDFLAKTFQGAFTIEIYKHRFNGVTNTEPPEICLSKHAHSRDCCVERTGLCATALFAKFRFPKLRHLLKFVSSIRWSSMFTSILVSM